VENTARSGLVEFERPVYAQGELVPQLATERLAERHLGSTCHRADRLSITQVTESGSFLQRI
jgi:hypothetical protein